jgi:thymidylate synthase ThyX
MNIVKPYARILQDCVYGELGTTSDPEWGIKLLRRVEWIGRISHRSEDAQTSDSWKRFIQAVVIDHGDWSIVEHASVTVDFMVDRGLCYDPETEVLSRSGWVSFPELTMDHQLACLTDEGELCWRSPQAVEKFSYSGDLLRFSNTSLDLLVTPGHNMWVYDYDKRSASSRVWKFLHADQLTNGRYKFAKSCSKWVGCDCVVNIPAHRTKRNQFPGIYLDSEKVLDLFELLGLWITDGSYEHGYGGGESIIITQSKPLGRKRIEELCSSLGFRTYYTGVSYRIDNGRLSDYVKSLFGDGPKTFTAHVPELIRNASMERIQRFLDGVMWGDGNVHSKNGHRVVYTSSYRFAGDLQELFMKVGLSANIRTIQPRERSEIHGNTVKTEALSYVVSVHGISKSNPILRRDSAKAFGTHVPYDGIVYCATVPWNRLYVRRNGKPIWCGNTHELVRHRLMAITQESTRFVNYEKKMSPSFVQPPFLLSESSKEFSDMIWNDAIKAAEHAYVELLRQGCTPQIARSVFPNALASRIVLTSNLRNWRHVLIMRTTKEAHPQMREVMIPLLQEFKEKIPLLFDDIEPLAKQSEGMRRAR